MSACPSVSTHQEGGVDDLRVGVVQEQDESRQAALVLDDGPAVHGVGGQVPQLVDHSQGVRLRCHGCTSLTHTRTS